MGRKIKRVRVIVREAGGAVLLMRWRDPVDGHVFWEPPGGGIKRGERPRDAAERELYEETGLVHRFDTEPVRVDRHYIWAGKEYDHTEEFFSMTTAIVEVALTDPTAREIATLQEMRFVALDEIAELTEPLEPPDLLAAIGRLR